MSGGLRDEPGLEPERYELDWGPAYRFEPDRRDLFRILGGGIVVLLLVRDLPRAQERGSRGRSGSPGEIGAWLHIGEDGKITAYTGKVEIGQGIRTTLTQVVAEELRVAPSAVQLVMGDTMLTPYDQGTFGSRTTPDMAPRLRRAAAAARELLIDLASERWSVDRAALAVADGRVFNPAGGQAFEFGALTKGEKLVQTIEADVATTPPEDWKVCGTSATRVDGADIVTGRHRYPSDVSRPGLLQGKVLRPAAFGATIASLDLAAAQAMEGVTVVRDGEFVGVAAKDEPGASRALAAIGVEWKSEPQPSDHELDAYLREHAAEGERSRGGQRGSEGGSVTEGLAAADQRLEATYSVAYIAHAPLEPRAAVAEWTDGRLTVWTGTQRPFGVREELAQAFGLSADEIRVLVPDMGSGYGGKHTGEAAIEAARLAKAAGAPVKVVWTREEEFTWGYFRPAGVIDVESGAMKDGSLTAWRFHNYNSGSSAIEPPYRIPAQEVEFHRTESPLRQGSYRALAATANTFAMETHLDEMARALGLDPYDLRVTNLDDDRLLAVLEAAAERFGWHERKAAPGRGFGIACGTEKGGYVATCAEVSVGKTEVRVERVVAAFECGAILDPGGIENQIQGALVMGLGGALFEAIRFENGKILNPRFSRYRVPRFEDTPAIEVVLLDHRDLPSAGAGEAPIIAIAPAIGNALFDATGERHRSLPLLGA
jgi:CO/xanthine dehydrogenase Mo-binding subunit